MRHLLAPFLLLAAAAVAQGNQPPSVFAVDLRILDAKGGPLQSARVQVLGATDGVAMRRYVPGFEVRELQPKDFASDFVRLDGLPVGKFVVRVEADHYALTCSEPFDLPARTVQQITVRMQLGTTLTGLVNGPDGKPMADVEVGTEVGGTLGSQHAFAQLMRAMFARTTTAAVTKTAADGTFRIDHVAPGEYRVVARHFAFAPGEVPLVVDASAAKQAVPKLELVRGALLTGTVSRGGRPVDGAEVVLESVAGTARPGGLPQVAVRLTAVTDAAGVYRMPVRVPLGASFQLSASENGAPLDKAAQVHASKRVVAAKNDAQAQVEDLQLPKR